MTAKGKPKPMILPQRAAAGTGKLMDNQDTVMRGDSMSSPAKRRRITFDTTESEARNLKALAASNGMSVRELMEGAISTLNVLLEANEGSSVQEIFHSIRAHPKLE
ncbi:MAG: hypothetical protein SOX20_03005 [Parolsenella sp.]|uniref:hypothetical protein n=1 Tax=Parolsenella sp. TaxID=2083006 RepID=UPI002A7571C5|nr:hypothetical protein [Parolsenella sp.]MDY3291881.1 hypothetical protein [Parolsenella sp.]